MTESQMTIDAFCDCIIYESKLIDDLFVIDRKVFFHEIGSKNCINIII
jgi:hypothetical protein